MSSLDLLQFELQNLADEKKAKHLSQFFKTGKGQYAEGDVFLGINIPIIKNVVKRYYADLSMQDIAKLLMEELRLKQTSTDKKTFSIHI